jgi:hypothetical protein
MHCLQKVRHYLGAFFMERKVKYTANILSRNFKSSVSNQKWATDITELTNYSEK